MEPDKEKIETQSTDSKAVLNDQIRSAKIGIEKLEQNFDQFRTYRQRVNSSIAEIKREMIEKGMNDFRFGIERLFSCLTWSNSKFTAGVAKS